MPAVVKRERAVKKAAKKPAKKPVKKTAKKPAKTTKKERKPARKPARSTRYDKEGIPRNLFCGPAGGARPGSFPVNTPRRAVAALSYARKAPNPEGIKGCVKKIAVRKGWYDSRTGRILLS